jgi:hypothetical protein
MDAGQEQNTVNGFSGFLAAVESGRRSAPKQRSQPPSRLGDILARVMEPMKVVQDETGQVEQAWAEVIPPHVAGHCRVRKLERGQLHVTIDSPVYAYEVRTCSHDLVKQIRQRCPRLGLRTIKVTLA